MTHNPYEVISYIGMLLIVGSGIPQVLRLFKTKSSKDISLTLYVMLITGVSCMLPYTIHDGNPLFILNYSLNLLLFLAILALSIRYRKN